MAHAEPRGATSVVIADDEPHVVAYLTALLEVEGFVVLGSAGDADGVVQLAHRLEPSSRPSICGCPVEGWRPPV